MYYIKEDLAHDCEMLIGLCFAGNRICDRAKSQLGVKFVMPRTAEIVHHTIAHPMLDLADFIGDYLESRNYSEGYPTVMEDFTEYENSKKVFDRILEYFLDLEKAITDVSFKAEAERDRRLKNRLDELLDKVVDFTTMAITFVDLSEAYGHEPKDNMQLDSNINKILGIQPEGANDDDDD